MLLEIAMIVVEEVARRQCDVYTQDKIPTYVFDPPV
jgi:hypothetical protein